MTWRGRWGQILREFEVRNVVLTTDDEAALFSMDAHVRDVEAKLCRARDDFRHIAEYWNGNANLGAMQNALEEIINTADNALSSTSPCPHEEEAKRLREAIEWACAWSCSVGEDNKLGYPFRQELRRRAKGE